MKTSVVLSPPVWERGEANLCDSSPVPCAWSQWVSNMRGRLQPVFARRIWEQARRPGASLRGARVHPTPSALHRGPDPQPAGWAPPPDTSKARSAPALCCSSSALGFLMLRQGLQNIAARSWAQKSCARRDSSGLRSSQAERAEGSNQARPWGWVWGWEEVHTAHLPLPGQQKPHSLRNEDWYSLKARYFRHRHRACVVGVV